MSDGGFLIEVEKSSQVVTATLLLPSELTGGEPERHTLATINRTLWEIHPELEGIFNDHMRKIVGVIVGSFGGTVDAMVKVPEGADVEAFVAKTMAAVARGKGY